MSPRRKMLRKVLNPPLIKGFKPYGSLSGIPDPEPVNLFYEEYEALRLSDYNKMNHHQASVIMGVSRPTFTRIYASALRKIATAFVEGRHIAIDGGKVYFDSDWYHCKKCGCNFNNPEKEKCVDKCPLCGSKQVKEYNYDNTSSDDDTIGTDDFCICPSCGHRKRHMPGMPCNQTICPECNNVMKRERANNPRC